MSISASVLAVVTAAIQTTKSLCATVKRYKERDKTLSRLQRELEDLTNILISVQEVVDSEAPMLTLLKRPIYRCKQVCHDFQEAMEKFSEKSKMGFRDWAKMEFMADDINGFMGCT